jgi:hypothetical protein
MLDGKPRYFHCRAHAESFHDLVLLKFQRTPIPKDSSSPEICRIGRLNRRINDVYE